MGQAEGVTFYMDLEKYAREVKQSGSGAALDKLAQSPAGERLAAKLDGKKLEQAAKTGDMQALSRMLGDILATPEGRDFARQVERTVKRDGR